MVQQQALTLLKLEPSKQAGTLRRVEVAKAELLR